MNRSFINFRVIRHISSYSIILIVNSSFSLLFMLFLANYMNISEYGYYGTYLSIANIVSALIFSGWNTLLLRSIEKGDGGIYTYGPFIFGYLICFSFILIIGVRVLSTHIYPDIFEILRLPIIMNYAFFKAAIFLVGSLSIAMGYKAIGQSFNGFIILVCTSVILYATLGFDNLTAISTLKYQSYSMLLCVILLGVFLATKEKYVGTQKGFFVVKRMVTQLPIFYGIGLAQILLLEMPVALGSFITSSDQIAQAKIVIQFAILMMLICGAVNVIISPLSRELVKAGSFNKIKDIYLSAILIQVIAGLAISIVFFLFGKVVLDFILPEEYYNVYRDAKFVIYGSFLIYLLGPAPTIMNMSGQEKYSLFYLGISLAFSLPATLLLTERFGSTGIIISVLVGWIMYIFLCSVHLVQEFTRKT